MSRATPQGQGMPCHPTFGAWLQQRRHARGVTQQELAAHLGFSSVLLRKLEAGERRPSGQVALLLAGYFHIPADEREAFVAFARTGRADPLRTESGTGSVPSAAPWRSLYRQQTNLPAVLTPLIGRTRELAATRDQLLSPKTRLLTLTGAPGIGKTLLGLQVAWELVEYFQDGVFFVDLAPVSDPDLVLQAIARSLGLKETADRSLERVLEAHVAERRMLVLLDNFEQVLDAAATVVHLLELSPWLKLLVTSREALHVRGERRVFVTPLPLPDPHQLPSVAQLSECPSVVLFVERARVVAPDFALTDENAADVAAICQRLEGLPLALELAAGRTARFSPREMRSALGSSLTLLTGGARDLPPRQRTLRGALTWSYDLLEVNEQRLFRSLGVFLGGFTSEAADMLSGSGAIPSTRESDVLMSLIDKHLVREERQAAPRGERRWGLLETMREYALEQLDQHGEMAKIREQHARYYTWLADQAEEHFTGAQGPDWGEQASAWIDRLEAELDNIRAALAWYQRNADSGTAPADAGDVHDHALDNLEQGLRLAANLRRVWFVRSHFSEGRQWLLGLLSKVPKPMAAAPQQFRAAYAGALIILGRLSLVQGDTTETRAQLEESLQIVTELNDKPRMALALLMLGAVTAAQGEYGAAHAYQRQCLALYRKLGNRWGCAAALQDLGDLELNKGQLVAARALLEESMTLYQVVGETFGVASALESLGRVAYAQRDYAIAYTCWAETLQRRIEIRDTSRISQSLMLLGWSALRADNSDEALTLFRQAVGDAREVGALFTIYWCLIGCGAVARAQQRPKRAAQLFGSAAAFGARHVLRLSPANEAELEAELAAAHNQLPDELWNKAWHVGWGMAAEPAIEYALS